MLWGAGGQEGMRGYLSFLPKLSALNRHEPRCRVGSMRGTSAAWPGDLLRVGGFNYSLSCFAARLAISAESRRARLLVIDRSVVVARICHSDSRRQASRSRVGRGEKHAR